MILPAVLYGCETWSLTLIEGHSRRVFGNKVLWRTFAPRKMKKQKRIMRNFTICINHIMLFGWLNQELWDGKDIQQAWANGEIHRKYALANLKWRDL